MSQDLEGPFRDGKPVWDTLYRARGDEVSSLRPIFTGDVFDEVPLAGPTGDMRKRSVLVLQHPCSMRIDGVRLADKLLVAEVSNYTPLEEAAWLGNFSLMPLPALRPGLASRRRDQAADFERLHAVPSGDLVKRLACLSAVGVNLLLQRWVHFSSRVVVPTWQFQATIAGEFDEADLIEDWCMERLEIGAVEAARECVDWLRDTSVSPTRQESLRSTQQRSRVRADMRAEIRRLRQAARP